MRNGQCRENKHAEAKFHAPYQRCCLTGACGRRFIMSDSPDRFTLTTTRSRNCRVVNTLASPWSACRKRFDWPVNKGILRLGFLAPDLIETMLNRKLPLAPNLTPLKRPIALDWAEQREFFGHSAHPNNAASSDAAATRIIPFRSAHSPKLL